MNLCTICAAFAHSKKFGMRQSITGVAGIEEARDQVYAARPPSDSGWK
jgi:hypothetical protein